MHEFKQLFNKYNGQLSLLTIIIITITAWKERFILDDAFISFRYSENFANGDGLVYNLGEHVEGYTNFLWTVLMSIPIKFGFSPIIFSQLFGVFSLFCTLSITYLLCQKLFKSNIISFISIILLGTNYTFVKYGTSGLETQLQTMLFMLSIYLTVIIIKYQDSVRLRQFLALSIVASFAIMTRLDSLIPIAILYLIIIYKLFIHNRTPSKKIFINLALMIFPALIILGSWFAWKQHYYGNILPNTFYIKIGSADSIQQGIFYLKQFILSYWLTPFLLIWVFSFKDLFVKSKFLIIILSIIIFWSTYVVKVGGDFMEFRFFVPIMPLIIILISYTISTFNRNAIKLALISLIIIGSFNHAINFEGEGGILSIRKTYINVHDDNRNWPDVGKILNNYFYDDSNEVIIATGAAGAVPFYAKLTNIDMLGLTDKWIAHNGKKINWKTGHTRLADIEYLIERDVNLIISYPMVSHKDTTLFDGISLDTFRQLYLNDVNLEEIPKTAKLVELPINDNYKITMLFLMPNKFIDSVIKKYNFHTYT